MRWSGARGCACAGRGCQAAAGGRPGAVQRHPVLHGRAQGTALPPGAWSTIVRPSPCPPCSAQLSPGHRHLGPAGKRKPRPFGIDHDAGQGAGLCALLGAGDPAPGPHLGRCARHARGRWGRGRRRARPEPAAVVHVAHGTARGRRCASRGPWGREGRALGHARTRAQVERWREWVSLLWLRRRGVPPRLQGQGPALLGRHAKGRRAGRRRRGRLAASHPAGAQCC